MAKERAWWSSNAKGSIEEAEAGTCYGGINLETLPEFVGVASRDPKLKRSWDLHRKHNKKSFHCSVIIKRLSKENVEPLLNGGEVVAAGTGKAEIF